VIPLNAHARQLYSGKEVVLKKLPIGAQRVPLRDAKGKLLFLQNSENNPGKGFIDLKIRMINPTNSYHGWIQKQASHKLGIGLSSGFKPRFFVLADGKFSYYDDEHSLDHPRGVIDCKLVSMFTYEQGKNGEPMLRVKAGDDDWQLHWMEDEKSEVICNWLRKLQYCCKNAPLNNDKSTDFLARTLSMTKVAKDSLVSNNSVDMKKTPSRRGSFFV
jgi:hypothetical protein